MKPAPYSMLLEAASRHNILTLTTSCAAACLFCSHHQNPAEVDAYYINKLTKEEVENLVEFLDGSIKITIGESATRICEGEPFAFEYIMDILKLIRQKYPQTLVQITTSGILLDQALVNQLHLIGDIELNISINSSSEAGRKKLYGGKAHMQAVDALDMVKEYGIKYNGSIVAMPHIVGWEDIEQTILHLSRHGAAAIRIFMPGYTRYTRIALPDKDILEKLNEMVQRLKTIVQTPIIIEPAVVENLDAIVEGVIADSPGHRAGMQAGDKVRAVNGKVVFSRVDAYNRLVESSNPKLSIDRDGRTIEINIPKDKKSSSGLVFNYDISSDTAAYIKNKVQKFSNRECLMPVSKLGYGIMSNVLEDDKRFQMVVAANNYFGGNIMCAGLLVLQDIADVLKQQTKLPEIVFLPQIMFDEKGRDLTGRHYLELEQEYGVEIVVL